MPGVYPKLSCKGGGRKVPRRGHVPQRDVLADPIYNDKVVTKLINNIMLDGKKGVAQKYVMVLLISLKRRLGKGSP